MLEKLVRPAIRSFVPYQWELSSEEVARRFGFKLFEVLRFDTNTNPFLPVDFQAKLTDYATTIPNINEYGDSAYTELRHALAAYNRCEPEQVVIGAGADEIIDMVAKLFLNNGDKALTVAPTYPVYQIATELMGAQLLSLPRGNAPNFEVDIEKLAQTGLAENAKLIWLCNPNNPTASLVSLEAIERLLELVDGRLAVAIDEAYTEFSKVTALPLVAKYPNLIIIRTFSKAFSLAGARLGAALAQPEMAAWLNQVRPPNSVSNLSVYCGIQALQPAAIAEMQRRVSFILQEKERFIERLVPFCEEIYPSAANFVLARLGTLERSERLAEGLLAKGIVVRRPGSMPGHFRLTVRLPAENDRLIAALNGLS